MKANITILFLLATILFSCNKSREQKKRLKKNEVILVMKDQLWKGEKGLILREIFEKEIYALYPPVKLFTLEQKTQEEFSRLNQTHKNILFVSSEVKDSHIKNKWAQNQIVMYLNSDSDEINFRKSCRETLSFLNQNELENTKHDCEKNHNKEARLYIKDQFGVELFLPKEYRWVQKKEGLFFADFKMSSTKRDLLKYIIVHEFEPINYDLQEEIISRTDSILKYIPTNEGKYVQIDNRVPLREDNGIYRGKWVLKNGFMGGPIIIKTRYIEDKVVVSLGIVFNPNESNRDYVRTFEAIL